jgi:hypothetical protein
MTVTRRAYAGAPEQDTLSAAVLAGDTSFSVANATNWPTGNPFFVVVSPGLSEEEKMLVTLSGTTVTVVARGADDTTANDHAGGATIYPCVTATDLNEANRLAAVFTTRGDLVFQGATVPERLAKGTAGQVLVAGADDPVYGTVGTTGLTDAAVTAVKLASNAVETAKILNAAVTAGKLASDSVETAKIVNSAVVEAKIADGAVTTNKLDSAAVVEGKLASNAVTEVKIADGAVAEAKIATGAVVEGKIGSGAVTEAKIGAGAVTAAKIGSNAVETAKIADDAVTVEKFGGPRGVHRSRGTNQAVANADETDITFPTSNIAWNTGVTYSAPNFQVQTGYGGWYAITVQATLSAAAGGSGLLILYVGARQYRISLDGGLVHQAASNGIVAPVAAGTNVKAALYQNSGGSINITDADFHIAYLGPSA